MAKELKGPAKRAYKKLEKMGVPVLPGGNWSAGSLFEISGEDAGKLAPNQFPWASYYCDGESMPFGVNVMLEAELSKSGLYCEWINPGVLGVYSAV